MPAWKVSDEQTASELLSRIGQDTSVYIDSSSPALDGSDAVILAPTAYKGVTMLITARRRNSTSAYEPAAVLDSPHTIPEETLDRISAVVSPGSALIVSDEALSRETGPATEFIVVMSGEPQGGIKIRRRDAAGRGRYERLMRRGPYGMGPSFW